MACSHGHSLVMRGRYSALIVMRGSGRPQRWPRNRFALFVACDMVEHMQRLSGLRIRTSKTEESK